MNEYPYVTSDIPGVGGVIKGCPEDFFVEEVPLYDPAGSGEHVYLFIEKKNLSTHEVVERASKIFRVAKRQIGMAGLKDKLAVTRQFISIPNIDESDAYQLEQEDQIKILSVARHKNKLRIGHLAGNNFRAVIRQPEMDNIEPIRQMIEKLRRGGVPNYFGHQRFRNSANIRLGRSLFHARKRARYKTARNKFAIQVYQSFLFNLYLAERIKKGWFNVLLDDDIIVDHCTNQLSWIENSMEERPRFEAFEISPTGPIVGYGMLTCRRRPGSLSAALEDQIFISEALNVSQLENVRLKKAKIYGSRRSLRVPLRDFDFSVVGGNLTLQFFLPKGAYGTVLLREFMKKG